MTPDRVQLVIGTAPTRDFGRRLDTWTEYRFSEDLFTPANDFSFKLALSSAGKSGQEVSEEYIEKVCELTQPDTIVRLELEGELLAVGIIDMQFIGGDLNEEYIEITGRDPAQVLLDNEVDPKLKLARDTTLPAIAETILERYRGHGIRFDVQSDNRSNRSVLTGNVKPLSDSRKVKTSKGTATASFGEGPPPDFVKQTIADARPHPGETEWDFLHRHAQNLGVIAMMGANGDLIFTTPDYDQAEQYFFCRYRDRDRSHQNNILSGGRRYNHAGTATSVHVLGRGSLYRSVDPTVKTRRKTKKKPKIHATAKTDRSFIWPRERFIRDSNPKDNDQALRTARRELAHRNANAVVYDYTVAGHSAADGKRYACDTMAHVVDEAMRPRVDASVYMTKRQIQKRLAAQNATTTQVTMVPKGAIVL